MEARNMLHNKCLALCLVLVINICFLSNLLAANIYVDQELDNKCTAGNYSMEYRNCGGSDGEATDGNAYKTLREALNSMSSGDDLFLRGGTYTATAADSNAVWNLPYDANGTSGNWTSIQSYPGEWAVLDGNSQLPKGVVIGFRASDSNLSLDYDYQYWLVQRLEITGGTGTLSGYACGIWMNGGPIKIRYCYIHDNTNASQNENPSGITGKVWHDTVVEYNYFKNNGSPSGTNGSHIAVFTDYKWPEVTDVYDINKAVRSNIIRYNLFDGAVVGFKHKGWQFLGDRTGTDMEYKDMGDKIHHNIFLNNEIGVMARQDFVQVYNNISEGTLLDQDPCSTCDQMWNATFYNNTVIGGAIRFPVPYGAGEKPNPYRPYFWAVNNIVDGFENEWNHASISGGFHMVTGGTIIMDNTVIDGNYVYRPKDKDHYVFGRVYDGSEFKTTTEFNEFIGRSMKNYTNKYTDTDKLYMGASGVDQYITEGEHLVGVSTTIEDGGKGGIHPYLSVTIPSYIGATNPNDNTWVAGVLNLANMSALKAGGSGDPGWIEGSGVSDTIAPNPPSEFRVLY